MENGELKMEKPGDRPIGRQRGAGPIFNSQFSILNSLVTFGDTDRQDKQTH